MTQLAELARHGHPTRQLDAFHLGDAAYLDELCGWAAAHLGTDPVVVRASAESAVVGAVQSRLAKNVPANWWKTLGAHRSGLSPGRGPAHYCGRR